MRYQAHDAQNEQNEVIQFFSERAWAGRVRPLPQV
jgi:hypothetical protein